MDENTVRESAQSHGDAVVAGDFATAGAADVDGAAKIVGLEVR